LKNAVRYAERLSPFSREKESFQKSPNKQNDNTYDSTRNDSTNSHNNSPSNLNMKDYSTSEQISKARKTLDAMEPQAVGKKAIEQSLKQAGQHYPKGSPERTAITQMLLNSRNGRPVDAEKFKNLTGLDIPESKAMPGFIDTHKLGNSVKAADYGRLDQAEHAIHHPSTSQKSCRYLQGRLL